MPKAIFLVGLCGAGKSRKAKQMQKDGFVWVEGIHGDPKAFLKLMDSLRAGDNCVVEEFQTLTAGYRSYIEGWLKQAIPAVEVEFWFFEKDIVTATRNLLERPDDKKRIEDHLLINGRNYDLYDIPPGPGTVILPIEPPTPYEGKA